MVLFIHVVGKYVSLPVQVVLFALLDTQMAIHPATTEHWYWLGL
jgi:hypothetical protein